MPFFPFGGSVRTEDPAGRRGSGVRASASPSTTLTDQPSFSWLGASPVRAPYTEHRRPLGTHAGNVPVMGIPVVDAPTTWPPSVDPGPIWR